MYFQNWASERYLQCFWNNALVPHCRKNHGGSAPSSVQRLCKKSRLSVRFVSKSGTKLNPGSTELGKTNIFLNFYFLIGLWALSLLSVLTFLM